MDCGGPSAWGKVGEAPLEDSLTAIVIGFACLEAEASGELTFGETTEVPRVIMLTSVGRAVPWRR